MVAKAGHKNNFKIQAQCNGFLLVLELSRIVWLSDLKMPMVPTRPDFKRCDSLDSRKVIVSEKQRNYLALGIIVIDYVVIQAVFNVFKTVEEKVDCLFSFISCKLYFFPFQKYPCTKCHPVNKINIDKSFNLVLIFHTAIAARVRGFLYGLLTRGCMGYGGKMLFDPFLRFT